MFIVGGFNAYPAEIENVLLAPSRIAQAAVIGVPDDRLGEVGMAFVVRGAPGRSGPDVIAWCREHMANYKVPRAVEVVDALPINESHFDPEKIEQRLRRLHFGGNLLAVQCEPERPQAPAVRR